MATFDLNSILDALERLGVDPDGKSGQVQQFFGYLAEEKLEKIYLKEQRPGVTAWFDQDATSHDWRDVRESDTVASFVEFVEERTAGAQDLIRLVPQKVPDISTLSGVMREFYELKPSLYPLQADRRVRPWGISDSNAGDFRAKAKSIDSFTKRNRILDVNKGTRWNIASSPHMMIDISASDFGKDGIPTLLGLDNNQATSDKLERLGDGLLEYSIPAAMTVMGYRFEFRRIEPGLVVWRLIRLATHPVAIEVPVTRQVPKVIEVVIAELKRISDENINAATVLKVVGAFVVIGTIAVVLAKVAIPALFCVLAFSLLASTATASGATGSVKILGNTMKLEPKLATSSVLARSVGLRAANEARDTAYVQMLLNGVRNRDGRDGLAVTGLCLDSTVSAIRDFTSAEFGKEIEVLRPGSLEIAILQTRFLEYTFFGSSVSDFSVFENANFSKQLIPEEFRDLPERLAKAYLQYLSSMHAAMPAKAPKHLAFEGNVPNGVSEDLVKRFGELPNASRLLTEIREIVGETSPLPTDDAEIYAKLAGHTDRQLAKANAIYDAVKAKVGQIRRRTAWGAYDWPDMTRKIKFDWKYDTIVIHHSGNGIMRANDTAEKVESYHRDKNRWADIGYHFVIHKDGSLHEARSLVFEGSHVLYEKGNVTNKNKIGVLMCGDFQHQWWDLSDDEISDQQLETVKKLVQALRESSEFGGSGIRVVGHRDLDPETECPGDLLAAALGQIG